MQALWLWQLSRGTHGKCHDGFKRRWEFVWIHFRFMTFESIVQNISNKLFSRKPNGLSCHVSHIFSVYLFVYLFVYRPSIPCSWHHLLDATDTPLTTYRQLQELSTSCQCPSKEQCYPATHPRYCRWQSVILALTTDFLSHLLFYHF